MKKNVMIVSGLTMLFVSMGTALAYNQSSVDSLSSLTGLDSETIIELRDEGATMMQIATEADVADEFKDVMLQRHIERINDKVEEGKLTAEEGALAIEKIETNIANCTGDGTQEKLNLAVGGVKQARKHQKTGQ